MKRQSSTGSKSQGQGQTRGRNLFGESSEDEDDDWSFSEDRGTGGSRKRKCLGDKSWSTFFNKKIGDFTLVSGKIRKSDPLPLPVHSSVGIKEFESPKKKCDNAKSKTNMQNFSEQFSEPAHLTAVGGKSPFHVDSSVEIKEVESPKKKCDDADNENLMLDDDSDSEQYSEPQHWTVVGGQISPLHIHSSVERDEIGDVESPKKCDDADNENIMLDDDSDSEQYSRPEHWTIVGENIRIDPWHDVHSCVEIGEFDSPKKKCDDANKNIMLDDFGRYSEHRKKVVGGKTRIDPLRDVHSSVEIGEFESPKKKCDDANKNMLDDTEQYSEQWKVVGGKRRKKRCLVKEFKAIVNRYDSSVRRFAQDYRLNKFDESSAMTLIIRHICGKEEKLIWTICRHIEGDVDRCVMFKPLYPHEIAVGVVLKLYPPWKEISAPTSVIVCTDFYRIGEKRENYFDVSEELRQEMISTPIPFNSSYIKVSVDDELSSLLSSLLPFKFRNRNTISKQTKSLVKPSIDLDAVIYHSSLSSLTSTSNKSMKFLLCDSDNCFFVLQLPAVDSAKKEQLLQDLETSQLISFQGLGIVSRTTILEDSRLFPIFFDANSHQKCYITVGLRHGTSWDVSEASMAKLDIPYHQLHLPQAMHS